MGTPSKKKKKRPPPSDTPPTTEPVNTPPSSSTHTDSGNATNYPVTSRTPSSEMSSPFNSAYVTLLTTPTTIPFDFKRPSTSIVTHSDIVITHQPSTVTQTTPTYTTVNTITTTVLIHTPPRTIISPMSSNNTLTTSTSSIHTKIPTSPKLTPIFPETITTPKISPIIHRNKKPKTTNDLSIIETIPASNSESDVIPYGRVIRKKKKKTIKSTSSGITSDSEIETMITKTPIQNTSTTSPKPNNPTPKANILNTPPSAPSKNIPPIYIYTNKYSILTKHITQTINPNPTFKFNNQALVCQPLTAETHKELTNLLKDNKIEFFTYNIQRLRPTKVAIKYIPTDIDNEDIETDLRQKNLPFIQISRIMISKGGRKTPSNILILTIPQSAVDARTSLSVTAVSGLDTPLPCATAPTAA